MLQSISENLFQEFIDKAVKEFWKWLETYVAPGMDTLHILSDNGSMNMNL